MLLVETTDLFDKASLVDAIGHGVNCFGAMGAGIAVQFREQFPEMYKAYQKICFSKELTPGNCWAWKNPENGKWVYNLAIKNHWKYPAKLEWVKSSFEAMLAHMEEHDVLSVALPMIGCNLGKLSWSDEVKPLLETISKPYSNIQIIVCKKNG